MNEDRHAYAYTFNLRLDDDDLDAHADDFNIPANCRVYRSAIFNTRRRGDPYPFKATSATIQKSDLTHSTSLVRFEASAAQTGHQGQAPESHFGEVLFFFTVELLGEDALAQDWCRQGHNSDAIK